MSFQFSVLGFRRGLRPGRTRVAGLWRGGRLNGARGGGRGGGWRGGGLGNIRKEANLRGSGFGCNGLRRRGEARGWQRQQIAEGVAVRALEGVDAALEAGEGLVQLGGLWGGGRRGVAFAW